MSCWAGGGIRPGAGDPDLLLYGRKLWETMSFLLADPATSNAGCHSGARSTRSRRNWRDTPKVVLSTTIDKVAWNARLVAGDAVAEITRLKAEDGGGR